MSSEKQRLCLDVLSWIGALSSQLLPPAVLLGLPISVSQAMNSATSTGKIMFHFGDMSQGVYFGDRRQTSVDFSNSALTSFETDMLAYRSTTRWDLVCANVGDATNAGSIITMKTA